MITPEGKHTYTHTQRGREREIRIASLKPRHYTHSQISGRCCCCLLERFGNTVLDCSISVHLYQLDTSYYVFRLVCRPNSWGLTLTLHLLLKQWLSTLTNFCVYVYTLMCESAHCSCLRYRAVCVVQRVAIRLCQGVRKNRQKIGFPDVFQE